jgi:hypothetical protein
MTHSEMTHWYRRRRGNVPYSACPGEMTSIPLPSSMGETLGPDGQLIAVTEVWYCDRCGYTIHLLATVRAGCVLRHEITNGYPAPSIPPLRIAPLN